VIERAGMDNFFFPGTLFRERWIFVGNERMAENEKKKGNSFETNSILVYNGCPYN
jgi:hypothetical protein